MPVELQLNELNKARRGSNQFEETRLSDISLSSYSDEMEMHKEQKIALREQLFDASKRGDVAVLRQLCGTQGIDPDTKGFMGWYAFKNFTKNIYRTLIGHQAIGRPEKDM
jgi:hypothetical protein